MLCCLGVFGEEDDARDAGTASQPEEPRRVARVSPSAPAAACLPTCCCHRQRRRRRRNTPTPALYLQLARVRPVGALLLLLLSLARLYELMFKADRWRVITARVENFWALIMEAPPARSSLPVVRVSVWSDVDRYADIRLASCLQYPNYSN